MQFVSYKIFSDSKDLLLYLKKNKGLANIEVTCRVDEFPIKYQPIDYNFFGVNLAVAGVGYNLVKSFATLGDEVDFARVFGKTNSQI